MLRLVSRLEAEVRAGNVRALSYVLITTDGKIAHDQSYSTGPNSVDWLAIMGAHDIAKSFVVGDDPE